MQCYIISADSRPAPYACGADDDHQIRHMANLRSESHLEK
jgi:hypothetical protein